MDNNSATANVDFDDIKALYEKYSGVLGGYINSVRNFLSARNNQSVDTKYFDKTITDYESYITQFENLVKDVNKICAQVVENWKGQGCKAFEKDYRQVQINLKDISDIMYELRDALADANAQYMQMDESLAKSYKT